MKGVTYDTGALIAAEARKMEFWRIHREALELGLRPIIPAAVLAQAWRGGSRPLLSQVLRGCYVQPFGERRARRVGAALAASGTADIVDATVVLAAADRDHVIITSDGKDLTRLLDAVGRKLEIHEV
jgi:hypothetical protein